MEKMEIKVVDNKVVLIAEKVVLSKILNNLEKQLSNIEEVHFVCKDVMCIDKNLKNEVWHGKNVVILTKTIKVIKKVVWDVSGKNNEHTYPSSAATGTGSNGENGRDGYAGENGGNVLILAETIENPENLTIFSNGGKGSKGQNGGNGRDGKDGKGITKYAFKKKFPSVIHFAASQSTRAISLWKTVENIKENCKKIEEHGQPNNEYFLKVTKNQGSEITFSYYPTRLDRQAFLLYKGSPGESGGSGGKCGLGGEGGYHGAIIVKNPETNKEFDVKEKHFKQGEDGETGQGGLYGNRGKKGWDMGYLDHQLWTQSEVRGGDEDSVCKLENCGELWWNAPDDSVWCPHENKYFRITANKIKQPAKKQNKQRNNDIPTRERQSHAKAKTKKCISQDEILSEYSSYFCHIKNSIQQGLQSDSEKNKKRALQESAVNQQEQQHQQQTMNIGIKRHLSSTYQAKKKCHSGTIPSVNYKCTCNANDDDFVHNLTGDKLDDWLELKGKVLTRFELDHLFSVLETVKKSSNPDNNKIQSIENLLIDHYRFAILQEIAKQLSPYQEVSGNVELSPESAIRYLIEAKRNDDTIYHPTLGTLYQYLYIDEEEQRNNLFDFCKKKLHSINNKTLKCLVGAFILEVGESEIENTSIKTYYGDYKEFLIKRTRRINMFFEAFKIELYHPMHEEDFDLWRKRIQDICVRTELEETNKLEEKSEPESKSKSESKKGIEKDALLNVFCNKFNDWIKSHYDWNECCKDQTLLERFCDHIKEKGPLSGSCRELLAHVFNINIRVYVEDKNNKYFLLNDYNSSSKQAIHLLYRDTKFIQLNIDENYLKLEEDRKNNDELYAKILAEIKLFKEKEKFDNYLNEKLFLPHNSPAENEQNSFLPHNSPAENEQYSFLPHNSPSENEQNSFLPHNSPSENEQNSFLPHNSPSENEQNSFLPHNSPAENEQYSFLPHNSPAENEQYFNEEECIKNIIEYFSEEEGKQLKQRLGKIIFQYTKQRGILHSILQRFSIEGRHVSFQELCYLINSVLKCRVEDRKEYNTFCWIVSSYPQRNWIDELILLDLEIYFKTPLEEKSKWREYLSKISNIDVLLLLCEKLDQGGSISSQCIEDILWLLCHILNETVSLEGLELSEWPYALKGKYWTIKLSKLVDWQNGDLLTASYYLLSVENIFGTLLTEKFLSALENQKRAFFPEKLALFPEKNVLSPEKQGLSSEKKALSPEKEALFSEKQGFSPEKQALSADMLTNILFNFHHEKWNLGEEEISALNNSGISKWVEEMEKISNNENERDISQLVKLIKDNNNTSKNILNNLSKVEEAIGSICNGKHKIYEKLVENFTEEDIQNWVENFSEMKPSKPEMLAVIDRAIQIKRELPGKVFKLRNTQKLTVLTLLTNDHTLAQMSTGEGKSLIIVAISIMKALIGEKVNIVTSSSALAERDAKINKDIYNLFGINVSHNCNEDVEKRKEAYSSSVVYGDLSSFQRDYLLDRFYGENILGDHDFKNVIVDEVDSMLLDKGINMLYLSHDLAGLDKLESVYIFIWQSINKPATSAEDVPYIFDAKAIKAAVLKDIYDIITREDIGKLSSELSDDQKYIIWERLYRAGILDSQGKLLKANIENATLTKILSPEFRVYQYSLTFLLKEFVERKKFIHIPNYLKPFLEQHLDSWIDSAIRAFSMTEGKNYVVDVDRSGTSPDRNVNIIILDTDTGTDQANSQWDEALHQFLQLKHGCKLSLQSLKAVFISNVSFFKLYKNLYGLTGTLGLQSEKKLLQEIYGVDFVIIPTAKPKLFREDTPVLCANENEWTEEICNEAQNLIKDRSVLIICETVNNVETLYQALWKRRVNLNNIYKYTREYELLDDELALGEKSLEKGKIVIATNLFGRGADIKITEELRRAEGLHVCLTYLPNNIRVEQQAFGRAARSGNKGSGNFIIMNTKTQQEYSNSKIIQLKKERDAEELYRISNIKAYYESVITTEENCFKKFKEQYERLKKDLDDDVNVGTEIKEILLHSCLDKWAFWLDRNSKYMKNVTDEHNKTNLNRLLYEFISQMKSLSSIYSKECNSDSPPINTKSWLAWVEGNPVQMIKLGKYFSQSKEHKHKNAYDSAIELFNYVIEKEPYFSEVAHYYKAFALANKINWEQRERQKDEVEEFEKELRESSKLLEERKKFSMIAAAIIADIKNRKKESIFRSNAYEEQQTSLANLYSMYLQSIEDILGHFVTSQSFVNIDINEELARVVYQDLLRKNILTSPRVKKRVFEKELKSISSDYGMSANALQDFLSEYKGKNIDKKEFVKALKKAVPLPSREGFWRLLIGENVFTDEVKYVIVDRKTVEEEDLGLLGNIDKQTLEINCQEQILLYSECVSEQKEKDIFIKRNFKEAIGEDRYKMLKGKGILSFNRKANITLKEIESINLSSYDSITEEDFAKVNITKDNTKRILDDLTKNGILERKNNSSAYRLKVKFNEIEDLLLSCPVYDKVVRRLLYICFIYRIVLQEVVSQLEEKKKSQLEEKKDSQLEEKKDSQLKGKKRFSARREERFSAKGKKRFSAKGKKRFSARREERFSAKGKKIFLLKGEKRFSARREERFSAKGKKDSQLKGKKDSISLRLLSKPHRSLVLSLLEHKIIKLAMVKTEGEDLEKEVRSIYSQDMTKSGLFEFMLHQGIPKESIGHVFKHLLDEKWIGKYYLEDRYYINKNIDEREPLSFSFEGYDKLQNLNEIVEEIFKNQLQLSKENMIKNIVRTLERSRSSLKALKVPDSKLKPLSECCSQGEFGNIEEINIFFLNGLDHLLQLQEKKWTREMLFHTSVVVVIGVCQIAIGTAIVFCSQGLLTHVGAAVINEGISDLVYAASALRSGYFSWKDYGQHKLWSTVFSAITAGVGASFSNGVEVSYFGQKIASPTFQLNAKKVAQMSGKELLDTRVRSLALKAAVKSFGIKTVQGVAFGLANAGIDWTVENHLKALCEAIASEISSKIEQRVEKHDLSDSLRRVFEKLGEQKAKDTIRNLTESFFTEKSCKDRYFHLATNIVSSVTQGIATAINKASKNDSVSKIPINNIIKLTVWSNRSNHIIQIATITDNFFKELGNRMNKINAGQKTGEQSISQKDNNLDLLNKSYEKFKEEMTDEWKSIFREKIGQMIAQHIVSPILKDGCNKVLQYVGKRIAEGYHSYQESKNQESFRKLKQANQNHDDMSARENNFINKKQESMLLKLMKNTKNPDLVAEIVREKIPMSLICAEASAKLLKEHGVKIPFTIVVEGDNDIKEEFHSMPNQRGKIIRLTLKNNHYQFCGPRPSELENNTDGNDCLYWSLTDAIPELKTKMTPEQFRNKVADFIKRDPEIRYHIQQGWHRLPLSVGAFGGARNRNTHNSNMRNSSAHNSNKQSTINMKEEKRSPYQHNSRKGGYNFVPGVDEDLRKEGELSNEETNQQLVTGLNTAINKINEYLSCIRRRSKRSVTLSDFTATKYDLVLYTKPSGEIEVRQYAVEFKSSIEEFIGNGETVRHNLEISVDNPVITPDLKGPHGPHVGYKISSPDRRRYGGVTGHILLNKNKHLPDRGRSRDNHNIPKYDFGSNSFTQRKM